MRIASIEVSFVDRELLALVEPELAGSYLGLIPRNSIFFFPEEAMRARILERYADIAAVSITRRSFSSIEIAATRRVPVARWCGLQKTEPPVEEEYCYFFDASGYVFAAVDVASTTDPLYDFALYVPLAGTTEEPLRATLKHAEELPRIFDFARQIASFGSPTATVTLRDDEVDVLLHSATRITYVRGQEEAAFAALKSAQANLSLTDGSIEYIDLRFEGKIYVRRTGEE